MKLNQIDKKLIKLIEKTINLSEETLKQSGQLPPMLITVEAEGKEFIHRFVEGEMKDLKLKAQEFIKDISTIVEYCALSYDGHVNVNSVKNDAIIAVGYSKYEDYAYIFAERYFKSEAEIRFEDEVSFVDQDKNILKNNGL